METKNKISIQTSVHAPVETAWKCWTSPEDIMKWNNASNDWFTPRAENDLRPGGKFNYRMEARDGSSGFDFVGVYNVVSPNRHIEYIIDDGRKVEVDFTSDGNETKIVETFEAENVFSLEAQRSGWQSILDNFKKYTEAKA